MSKFIISFVFAVIVFVAHPLHAQFEPKGSTAFMITAGIGASGWGIPLFGRLEIPVSESITVGGGVSYQTNNQTFSASNKWRHSIIGIHGRGNYHFNTLLDIPDNFDLYAGASIGYYVWNTTYKGDLSGIVYGGTGSGGTSLGLHFGGRYFLGDSHKTAVNLEVGGGNVISAGTIGVTFLL